MALMGQIVYLTPSQKDQFSYEFEEQQIRGTNLSLAMQPWRR